MFKWITIAIAGLGLGVGIYTAATSSPALPSPPPAEPPSINPYPDGVAGTGLVEASTRNVEVAAPEPGQVAQVFAEVNRVVKAGDPLFQLDPRPLEAELIAATAACAASKAELARLKAQPRPEDVPPLEAAVARAKAVYLDRKDEYDRIAAAAEAGAATANESQRRRFALQAAEAELRAAEAELDRVLAGAWEQDIAVAEAQIALTEAQIEALRLRIERLTVRSPIDGTVLKRRVEPGERAEPAGGDAAIVVGDLTRLHVRAQIDEADAPLVRSGAAARARMRGRTDASLPLKMIRIEPLAVPKRQLTGAGSELVDTRIVEVLFEVMDTQGVPIYPGQIVDVFVDVEQRKETGVRSQESGGQTVSH